MTKKNPAAAFWLDISGGERILKLMAVPLIRQSAQAIADRAMGLRGNKSTTLTVEMSIGSPNKRGGTRAVASVVDQSPYAKEHYRIEMRKAVQKSIDAGRV